MQGKPQTPENVKLLLPPRQSRWISQRNSLVNGAWSLAIARTPSVLIQLEQILRISGKLGIFSKGDLELRIRQLFQHSEDIELRLIDRVFDFLNVHALELLAPVVEALLEIGRAHV